MDYHGMGFRECVAEVVRYLERIEGLDIQNPLRLRLTSHLQCCAAQRELASKQATTGAPWTYGPSQPYPPLNPLLPAANQASISNLSPHQPSLHHQNIHDMNQFDISTSCPQSTAVSNAETSARIAQANTTILTPLTTTTSTALGYSPHQYPVNTFTIPTSSHHQNYNQNNGTSQGMKPYRPWGAGVAY